MISVNACRVNKLDESLANRWRKIPVAVTVDLDDKIRQIDPQIRPLRNDCQVLFGCVVTAQCQPPDFGAVLRSLDILEDGDVLLIAAGGYPDNAMIGDILSGHLRSKGIAGVVCDGAVRDVATLRSFDNFPVYARSINPRGPTGVEKGAINVSVDVSGIEVLPGDYLMGDADGLVVLSVADMETHIKAAEDRLLLEQEWQERLANGEPVADVFGLKS